MRSNTRFLIFAKAPVPGQAKTRLIPALGEQGAAQLAARLLAHTLETVQRIDSVAIELWCAPDTSHPAFMQFQRHDSVDLMVQSAGDLGQRMAMATRQGLAAGDIVILLGTDCPMLDRDYLLAAMDSLRKMECAIAPAEDGGYALLGLSHWVDGLFSDMAWGTDKVFDETIWRLKMMGQPYAILPEVWDVDRPQDLDRLKVKYPDLLH